MFKTHLLYSFIKILSYNFSFSIIIKFYLHYCCDFDYFIFNIFNILFDLFSLWYCFVSTLPVMARPRTTPLTWEVPTPEFLMGLTQVQHWIIYFSSMASNWVNFCWNKTGLEPNWMIMYRVILQSIFPQKIKWTNLVLIIFFYFIIRGQLSIIRCHYGFQ